MSKILIIHIIFNTKISTFILRLVSKYKNVLNKKKKNILCKYVYNLKTSFNINRIKACGAIILNLYIVYILLLTHSILSTNCIINDWLNEENLSICRQ